MNSSVFYVNRYVTQHASKTMASVFTFKGQFELTRTSCHVISRPITLQQLCIVNHTGRHLLSFPSVEVTELLTIHPPPGIVSIFAT